MDAPLLMACSRLAGGAVVDANDREVGRLDHLVIDVPTGRIAYAVLARGGVFGIGQTLFEVPWTALRLDPHREVLVMGT